MLKAVPATEESPFGNSRVLEAGPVAICCMLPEAKDIMELSLERYHGLVKRRILRASTPSYVRWLFEKSGLVEGMDRKRVMREYLKHRDAIRKSLENHPNRAFARSVGRGRPYSFAYWFFRWSGFVKVTGA